MALLRSPLLALLPLLVAPAVAHAGACPQCTSNADCVTVTEDPNAVCVEWTTDFGCGDLRVSCCPGQNCALVGTQPSCQIAGACAPFGGSGTDAAVALDIGSLDGAGAPPPLDGSPSSLDDAATSTAPDASSIGRLGGGSANRESRCNCESATTGDAPTAALALAAALVFVARRRRPR